MNDKDDLSFLTLFSEEMTLQADNLEKELESIRQLPKPLEEQLTTLQRIAHSIKGTAKIVGLEKVVQLGIEMGKCFSMLQKDSTILTPKFYDLMAETVAVLKSFATIQPQNIATHADADIFTNLIIKLSEIKKLSETTSPQTSLPIGSSTVQPSMKPSKASPIPSASDFDISMGDLFVEELKMHTKALVEGLKTLESNPKDKLLLQTLRRAVHSIKGAAKVVNLEPIVIIARAMEEVFIKAFEEKIVLTPEKIDVMFIGAEYLGELPTIDMNAFVSWINDTTLRLEEIVNKIYTIRDDTFTDTKLSFTQSLPSDTVIPPPSPPTPQPPTSPPQPYQPSQPSHPLPPQKPPEPPVKNILQQKFVAIPQSSLLIKERISRLSTKNLKEEAVKPPIEKDRVLRVTAKNLNRLMGLAGEALVESRWLQPFADELHKLKKSQYDLSGALDHLQDALLDYPLDNDSSRYLHTLQQGSNRCRENLLERLDDIEMFIRRHISHSDRLYNEVINSRMRPFAEGIEGFPLLVQNLAAQLGKKVRLVIAGKSTPVDREILERLEAPINHLLRNAVDHGIETPEVRRQKGKPEEGEILLEARHVAGILLITISDDGRGVDQTNLRQIIVEKKLATEEMTNDLSDLELMDFLFLPGFSTASKVTDISGRGFGLNVVQEMIHEVGGEIRVIPKKDKGVEFHLQLPLTLSVIRSLIVNISGEPYAFPLARIDCAIYVKREEINVIENRQYISREGKNIGLILSHQVLQLPEPSSLQQLLPVVVFSDRAHAYGIVVDEFIGERELVAQEIDQRLGKVQNISTGAFTEDGSPILIIDLDELLRSTNDILSGGNIKRFSYAKEQEAQTATSNLKRILVVDDSITVRKVQYRLLRNYGYHVDTASNGVEGWNAVRARNYDLVVTDIDMPHMNGIELVSLIKNDPMLRHIPVIIVSYKEGEEDRKMGLDAGANFYLTKSSFRDQTFINAVQNLIGNPVKIGKEI